MYKYELVKLLEKVLYPSYEMKGGEHAFHCPFCNHHKKKLQVNFETQKWHCWVCNAGGHKIGILLRKINAPKQIISEVLKLLGDYKGVKHEKDEKTEYNVSLPQCYQPLWKPSKDPLYTNAISYLKRRGIGGIDILRYSMGYCSSNGYANRIIIPSYDADGKLNYFIARDMFPNSKLKYKNPPMSKDTVCFEMFVNWNEPIVLCEGVFDAIAIRRNVIPLLGKFPSKTLVTRLVEKKVSSLCEGVIGKPAATQTCTVTPPPPVGAQTIGEHLDAGLTDTEKTTKDSWTVTLISKIAGILKSWFS